MLSFLIVSVGGEYFCIVLRSVGEIQMRGERKKIMALACMAVLGLAGCSRAPETLARTTWKITGLTSPDGTEYDEAAYDAIIGVTVYTFDEMGNMNCSVDGESTGIYSYVYERGQIEISSEELECSGTVGKHIMKLQLGEKGEAVLTEK